MTQVYNQYSKARIGWFPFGLTGWQGAIVAVSTLPVFWSLKEQAWASAGMFALICAAVSLVTVVPVRGRSLGSSAHRVLLGRVSTTSSLLHSLQLYDWR